VGCGAKKVGQHCSRRVKGRIVSTAVNVLMDMFKNNASFNCMILSDLGLRKLTIN